MNPSVMDGNYTVQSITLIQNWAGKSLTLNGTLELKKTTSTTDSVFADQTAVILGPGGGVQVDAGTTLTWTALLSGTSPVPNRVVVQPNGKLDISLPQRTTLDGVGIENYGEVDWGITATLTLANGSYIHNEANSVFLVTNVGTTMTLLQGLISDQDDGSHPGFFIYPGAQMTLNGGSFDIGTEFDNYGTIVATGANESDIEAGSVITGATFNLDGNSSIVFKPMGEAYLFPQALQNVTVTGAGRILYSPTVANNKLAFSGVNNISNFTIPQTNQKPAIISGSGTLNISPQGLLHISSTCTFQAEGGDFNIHVSANAAMAIAANLTINAGGGAAPVCSLTNDGTVTWTEGTIGYSANAANVNLIVNNGIFQIDPNLGGDLSLVNNGAQAMNFVNNAPGSVNKAGNGTVNVALVLAFPLNNNVFASAGFINFLNIGYGP
jgi:hypothetical protein